MRHHTGRVEVICGGMFSGKTEELIRRVRRAIIAKQSVQVFKPQMDTRYIMQRVTSHNGQDHEAKAVENAQGILEHLRPETTVVAIDEVQFFDSEIERIVEILASRGMRVIVAGLDMDFRGEPFGPMPALLCRADYIQKLHAICPICGEEASRSQRLVDGEPAPYDAPLIWIGAKEAYEPRCREHHEVPGHPLYAEQAASPNTQAD